MNSKQEIIVEIFEEHSEVNFYSIRYSDNSLSEAELFFDKVLDDEHLEEDVEILSKLLDKIGKMVQNQDILDTLVQVGTKLQLYPNIFQVLIYDYTL